MEDILLHAIVALYDRERFYAELLLQMDRVINKSIPTACVTIKQRIQLHVNPDFFKGLTLDEQMATLKHECAHIFNDHINRAKEAYPDIYSGSDKSTEGKVINNAKHMLVNVAADCSINHNINHLPKGAVYPKQFKLDSGETMEWYVEKLKNNEELKGLNSFDEHSLWGESEGCKEELKEKVKKAIETAAEKTKAAGKLTASDELLINKFNRESRSWRNDLRQFVGRNVDIKLRSSKKKRNRRYGTMYPGTVKDEYLRIGVAIDTSGSVSDEALQQFMAEIRNIAKYADVTIVEADCEVKNHYKFDKRKDIKIKGRGGTAYQPALDFFSREGEVDGVIYFGDMDVFDEQIKKPLYPVLWAIVGNAKPPVNWGRSTRIPLKSSND